MSSRGEPIPSKGRTNQAEADLQLTRATSASGQLASVCAPLSARLEFLSKQSDSLQRLERSKIAHELECTPEGGQVLS
jgi:hypothetical protein